MKHHRKLAVLAGAALLSLGAAGTAQAGGTNPPPKQTCKNNPKKCPPNKVKGRMTGHGHATVSGYGRVAWEFRNSICGADKFPDLKVAWGGNRFILTAYSTPLVCLDTAVSEGQPRAGFDTIVGQGTGTLNGVSGASATFRFTDAGEPGRADTATIRIVSATGDVVLNITNVAASGGGNHQAHRLTGADAR